MYDTVSWQGSTETSDLFVLRHQLDILAEGHVACWRCDLHGFYSTGSHTAHIQKGRERIAGRFPMPAEAMRRRGGLCKMIDRKYGR